MSTRLYFDSSAAPQAFTGVSASSIWTQGTSPVFYRMLVADTVRQYPASVPGNGFSGSAATGPRNVMGIGFVTEPLPAQVLSGTFTICVPLSEATATQDCMLQVVIRVLNNANTVVRGTAYSGQTATTVATTRALPNYELSVTTVKSRFLQDIPLTNVTLQAGDRIAVEIGARTVSSASVSGTISPKLVEASPDVPLMADRFAYGNERSWIEFSQDLFGALDAEEFRYMTNGILLNGDSSTLPFVDITSIDGLDNAPVGLSQTDREGAHGGYVTASFEGNRTVTLEGDIYANNTALETYLDSLKKNFAPTRSFHPLFFGTDAGVRKVMVKSLGLRAPKKSERRLGKVPFQVQLIAQDPRIYDATQKNATMLADGSFGFLMYVLSPGDRDTPAKITLQGPWTSPSITLQNLYGYMTMNFTGQTLAATDILDIDLDACTVILNNATNWRSKMIGTPNWILMAGGTTPAETNTFEILSSSGAEGRLIVTWNDAWS